MPKNSRLLSARRMADSARGAMRQTAAKALLQFLQILADHVAADVECLCRSD
ncbi:hypothetical protein [Shewanella fodinae]|uniref:hypothetical protein n=1 Tax=Shewanella fodinae TaxID=552357 RepID=UPI00167AFACB|nr:hypothetical protein [Shewanella fodinae]MCL2906208.1 hypothetical protein [Shewanella fodinae]